MHHCVDLKKKKFQRGIHNEMLSRANVFRTLLLVSVLLFCAPLAHAEDVTGWSWRLVSESGTAADMGLLEVLPAGQSDWGTVCIAGFGMMEAMAMCRTLGFTDIPIAFSASRGGGGWGVGPVYLSDVSCPAGDATASNCSFAYASNGDNSTCSHSLDVYLDCSGHVPHGDASQRYRSFISVVLAANFTTEGFAKKWATYFNMSDDRILFLQPFPTFESYLYVNWTIVDDNSTMHFPASGSGSHHHHHHNHNNEPVPEGQLSGLNSDAGMLPNFTITDKSNGGLPFPIPGLGFQEGMNIGMMPREILMYIVSETYAATLWEEFGIFEQRDNLTMPNGPVSADHTTWSWSLQSVDGSLSSRFGRVQLQPGKNAMYGSICNSGTDASVAMALCQERFPDSTLATLIPYFRPMVGGVIYASNMQCTTGKADSCSFTMSSQFEKRNPCTHLQDIGILCGRQVVPNSAEPVTYGAYVTEDDSNFCTTGVTKFFSSIANITSIPASRFVLQGCSAVASSQSDHVMLLKAAVSAKYLVNFSFSDEDEADELARADLDVILQSTNEAALMELCDIQSLTFSQNVVTEAPSNMPTDMPTDFPTDMPTNIPTNAPGSPGTNAPGSPGTNAPGSPGTNAPGSPGTNAPGSPGTNAPGSPGTNAPGSPGTNAPGSPGTNAPGSPGTDAPATAPPSTTVYLLVNGTGMTTTALASIISSTLGFPISSFTVTQVSSSSSGITFSVVFASAQDAQTATYAAENHQLGNDIGLAPDPNFGKEPKKSNIGAIIGGVVGAIIAVAVIAVVVKVFVLTPKSTGLSENEVGLTPINAGGADQV